MEPRRDLLAAALLAVSITALQSQVPAQLIGQDRLGWRRILEGPTYYDSLILTFGTEPTVVSAEFRLTYRRTAAPDTGTIELLIADGPYNGSNGTLPIDPPLARKPLTMEEFVAIGSSDAIDIDGVNFKLILVDTQRGGIARQAAKWTRQR